MAKKAELQKASDSAYKLVALTKTAALASENLETSEVNSLFELAFNLSCDISTFLIAQETEAIKNEK